MILIDNKEISAESLSGEYSENSIERNIINKLSSSGEKYRYDSVNKLKFEIKMRSEIIKAAKSLYSSRFDFAVFRKSRCNPKYWNRTDEGGFELKSGVSPSEAIRDIYANGSEYATECATAMIIVYYKALSEIFPAEVFDELFPKIHLMNWHYIDRRLKEVGLIKSMKDYLPGDRRYFSNPDVNPLTPEWQGENVIDLGNGMYYGHGIGIHDADTIIRELNKNRKENADDSAYLNDSASRPDFNKLADLYYGNI